MGGHRRSAPADTSAVGRRRSSSAESLQEGDFDTPVVDHRPSSPVKRRQSSPAGKPLRKTKSEKDANGTDTSAASPGKPLRKSKSEKDPPAVGHRRSASVEADNGTDAPAVGRRRSSPAEQVGK